MCNNVGMTTNRMNLSTIHISDVRADAVQVGQIILLSSIARNSSTIERWIVDEKHEVGDDVILSGEAPEGLKEITISRSNLVTVIFQAGPHF